MAILDRIKRLVVARALGLTTQSAYEQVLDEAATVRLSKVREYGESRYSVDDPLFNIWMTFSDVYRKYIRLEQLVRDCRIAELRSTYMDMLNYCAMAVQIIDKMCPDLAGAESENIEEVDVPQHRMFDQVAIAFPANSDQAFRAENILSALGYGDWTTDTVSAEGSVGSMDGVRNKAKLRFNYDMMPVEFELLEYDSDDDNWHFDIDQPRISHIGIHVTEIQGPLSKLLDLGYGIAQDVTTQSHTNPAIAGKRRYRYVVVDTRDDLGYDIKLIQRIDVEDGHQG